MTAVVEEFLHDGAECEPPAIEEKFLRFLIEFDLWSLDGQLSTTLSSPVSRVEMDAAMRILQAGGVIGRQWS